MTAASTLATGAVVAYEPVPLEGLAGARPLAMPLYLRTGPGLWVLYRDVSTAMTEEHVGRLRSEGVTELWIRAADRAAYHRRVEAAIDGVLRDPTQPVERRAEILHGVAVDVAHELLTSKTDHSTVVRAQRLMVASCGLMLREPQGFRAIRRVLGASQELCTHSLTVGFLAMGLARQVLGPDPSQLLLAGLAGLLHDVGRVGHERQDHDPAHPQRGHQILVGLDLPAPVCEAALGHHERHDGSGYPRGSSGRQIPEMARIVGLVDTFDKVYSGQQPRVGVYEALRILAQAYRGCFDDALAQAFVLSFRG